MGTAGSWQWRRGERCLPRPLTLASRPLPASEPAYCNSTLSVGCLPCWPPYLSVRLLCGQSSQRQPGVTFASRWPRQGSSGHEKGREERRAPGETPIDGGLSSGAAAGSCLRAGRGSVAFVQLWVGPQAGEGGQDPAEGQGSCMS